MFDALAEVNDSTSDSFIVAPSAGLILWTLAVCAIWFGLAYGVARYGQRNGQGFWALFACSLVFSPVVTFIVAWLIIQRRGPRHVGA